MALIALAAGCVPVPQPDPEPDPVSAVGEWRVGDEVPCAAPSVGFDALTEEAASHGVDQGNPPPEQFGHPGEFLTEALAHDLDGDGDVDLAFGRPDGRLNVYANDGAGGFDWLGADLLAQGDSVAYAAFADLDGDRLPELIRATFDGILVHRNLGEIRFGDPQLAWNANASPWANSGFSTLGIGDLDGDGDLDLVVPTLTGPWDGQGNQEAPPPGEDLVLFNDGAGVFGDAVPLAPDSPGMSQLAVLSDRDSDGDLDVYVGSDLTQYFPPGTFYRNDGTDGGGLPMLVDDGAAIAAELPISHMGVDVADLNRDGLLDYCFTDTGPVACLMSDPSGVYVDVTAVAGLVPAAVEVAESWVGWSIEIVDLDNDGLEDIAVAAGRTDQFENGPPGTDVDVQPNGLWRGTGVAIWTEVSDAVGFSSTNQSYGLTTADLDGDGALEIIVGNEQAAPEIFWNGCTAGSWLDVELVGTALNSEAFGAQVIVEAGGQRWIREIHGLRTVGQGPSRAHFGLGMLERADRVTVRWPDGAVTSIDGPAARRVLTAVHPAALE